MKFKIASIFIIILIVSGEISFAQEDPAKPDSAIIYGTKETYSSRSKFTQFMYRLFYKPGTPNTKKSEAKKKAYKKLIHKPYNTFEGKVIRNIYLETMDPFGYTIADTIVASRNLFLKTGNYLHLNSKSETIRNLLLITENQLFDSLRVRESERLIRQQEYVRDVSFFVAAASKNSDSVDIYIRELDKWSIIPRVVISKSRNTISLTDNNFLGLGHEFGNSFTWFPNAGNSAYNINYYVPNIGKTYINTNLHFGTDEFRNSNKSIVIERPFFSPLTRWAGGISFTQHFREDFIPVNDSIFILQEYKFNKQDYWAGIAIKLKKGYSENDRTTKLVTAVRFSRIFYLEKPIEEFDTLNQFSNENYYMASIGISRRKYVKDKFIFNFGVTEDIPVGKLFNLTGGYKEKTNTGSFYFGARIAFGDYYTWGYLSANFEYGTFYRSNAQQGIFSAGAIYFTGLVEIGKWKFRQFVKPQVLIGINRLPYESITLNDGYGLDGFNSTDLSGNSRLLFTLQTQSYAPWNIIGFRFGPFVSCSLGMLSDAAIGFQNSKLFSQIGLGILIKNDYLVINTFQISISFYPSIPGIGQGVFKMNSIRTTDFGFGDFDIEKPATVLYQ